MTKSRMSILSFIAKGLLSAITFTLPFMLLFALMAAFLRISDELLTVLNQFLKAAAIVTGARIAVGRGGERGFLTGMLIGMLYMILGYMLYIFLGGNAFTVSGMLGEILIGAAVGSVSGAVFANLSPKKGKKRPRAA